MEGGQQLMEERKPRSGTNSMEGAEGSERRKRRDRSNPPSPQSSSSSISSSSCFPTWLPVPLASVRELILNAPSRVRRATVEKRRASRQERLEECPAHDRKGSARL